MFRNLNGIFACVPQRRYSVIPCGVVVLEEDSFTDGRAILQAIIDRGKEVHIFSSTEGVYTYAMAMQGCSQLTTSCWSNFVKRGSHVTCKLRQYCG